MKKAPFIIIEGGECSGKGKQTNLLVSAMQNAGLEVKKTHEPGGTKAGDMIREILQGPGSPNISAKTELFLFEAARSAWVDDVVVSSLNRDQFVVADRSFPSTIAYQGYAGGMDLDIVREMNNIAMSGAKPDIIIIIDISYETMAERMSGRDEDRDRIEDKGEKYHQKVLEGYRQFGKENIDNNVVLIDGEGSIDQVQEMIVEKINELFELDLESVPANQ